MEAIARPTVDDVLLGNGRWAFVAFDCLEWLKSLPENCIDLMFFSPPYSEARLYLENGKSLGIARKTDAWVLWMMDVFSECRRVCKGLVACVCDDQTKKFRWNAAPALLMAELHRAGFVLRKPPIYSRSSVPGSGGPDWLRNNYEFIVCTTRGGRLPWSDNKAMGHAPKYDIGGRLSFRTQNGERINGRTGKRLSGSAIGNIERANGSIYSQPEKANPGNIIHCKVGGGLMGHRLAHENEAPFPLTLAEFFVRSFCPPGGVVCDPFLGSGTTAHAAFEWNRRFIGCDLRPSQVDLATRRMESITPNFPEMS